MARFSATLYCVLIFIIAVFVSGQIQNQSINQDITGNITTQQNMLDITYNRSILQELDPGIVLVVGNQDQIILTCESTVPSPVLLRWFYHGIQETDISLKYSRNKVWLKGSRYGPPVARMECLRNDPVMSKDVVIYFGDSEPPFLYKAGEWIAVTLLDSDTIQIPCLLNYPIRRMEQFQLQLFKDGEQLNVDEITASYSAESGYLIKWKNLSNPFGTYECRVLNSTTNDFVKTTFSNDFIIRSEIEVKHSLGMTSFFEGDPQKRVFRCTVPRLRFENIFEWNFLLVNGSYMPVNVTKSRFRGPSDPLLFMDAVKFTFPTKAISHVVCAAYTKINMTKYNNSYAVEIKEPVQPRIIRNNSLNQPITYVRGMNLTCKSIGDPINIMWLKNGEPVYDLNAEYSYISTIRTTTLFLNPSVDDLDSNYTCKVENFMEQDNITFRVQLHDPNQNVDMSLIKKGICIAVRFFCGSGHCPSSLFNNTVNMLESGIRNSERGISSANIRNIIHECMNQTNNRRMSSPTMNQLNPEVSSDMSNFTQADNQI